MDGPEGLQAADPGVRLLADAVADVAAKSVLLVHCGDLPGVRPGATRLVLDVREHTRSVHRCVAVRLDADALGDARFLGAACWPRAHLGIDFSMANLATAASHLQSGGRLWCAARKQKGGKRLAATMKSLLGNVRVDARDRGYHLYVSERGSKWNEALARELGSVEYEIRDERLGDLVLRSVPGVFSRKHLDAGTGVLLEHLREHGPQAPVSRVVDLGAGVGPLALAAASRWPAARVLAVDANLLAAALARYNAERSGLSDRIRVAACDGLAGVPTTDAAGYEGRTQLLLVNPPTHASPEGLARLLSPICDWLEPGGRAMVVVNRPGRATAALAAAGLEVSTFSYPHYSVLEAVR